VTVIAWDGKTLAADRRAITCGRVFSVTKVFRVGAYLVGISGCFSYAGQYLAWLADGRDPAKYPKQELNSELYMIVVHRDGTVERFEASGYPVKVEEQHFAGGSGCDFAIAALACGKTAREAVEIACLLSSECGNGVDTLAFEETP
jgi:hypothetical protein